VIRIWSGLPRSFWSLYALDVGRAYFETGLLSEAEHHLSLARMAQQAFFMNQDMNAQHNMVTWMLAQAYLAKVFERTGRHSDAIAKYRGLLKPFQHLPASLPWVAAARPALARAQFSQRGKLLFSDEFSGSVPRPGWEGDPALGTWEVADGVLNAAPKTADGEWTSRNHHLPYRDTVFEFAFRLDTARMAGLALRAKSGLVAELILSPGEMTLATDWPRSTVEGEATKLVHQYTVIEPAKWHKVVFEVRGRHILAQLDGRETIVAEGPDLDVNKTDFGLVVRRGRASFDYVRVYEAVAR
jgi:hypothetical protein